MHGASVIHLRTQKRGRGIKHKTERNRMGGALGVAFDLKYF